MKNVSIIIKGNHTRFSPSLSVNRIYSGIAVLLTIFYMVGLPACKNSPANIERDEQMTNREEKITDNPGGDTLPGKLAVTAVNYTSAGGPATDTASAGAIVQYAYQYVGIPYKYASANPAEGFDCSGFLYHVFNHFNIDVPRSSKDYMNFGKKISTAQLKPGDFIVFTGTDSTIRVGGHVGLVIQKNGNDVQFIHASSGKANGVTISPLAGYYQTRYLSGVRILEQVR